jgi:hypothetical protein
VYNSYQIHEIGRAIELGVVTNEMYNPSMSDMDINILIQEKLEEQSRVLSVSLKNKSDKS